MSRALRVLHIASGDLWAGAEVQAFTLMSHLERMPQTEVAVVLMNPGGLADRLRAVGVGVYVLDEHGTTSLGLLRRLWGVLNTWRPDVVHTHRQKENILGSLANRCCRDVPSVRTVHGAEEHSGPTGVRGLRRQLISRLDQWCGCTLQQRIIAVTRDLGAQMVGHFPANRIVVIENGVDFAEVRAHDGVAGFRSAEPGVTHVGIAGRLVEVKRVDVFLEAAALLLHAHPERHWRFHVFGDGPLERSLKQRSEHLRLREAVTFHGHRDDMATCLAGLDVLVICSDHEGMPMVALEAAVLAVPTVAHAVGGLKEVVPAEFLVSQHDARGYRQGIERALSPDGRAIAARHGAEICERFSAERNAERVRALYEQVLAERNDVQ